MSDLPTSDPRKAFRGEIDPSDVAACLRVLGRLIQEPSLCDCGNRSLGKVRRDAARLLDACQQERKRAIRQRDRDLLDAVAIRSPGAPPGVPIQPCATFPVTPAVLSEGKTCYVCKQAYTQLHPFYDCLCPACGDLNYARRNQTADLTGRVALLTGGRVKIGYATALKLLRAGAVVLVTTRFPRDAARRYAQEADFRSWADRLQIHALDLRNLPAVDSFAGGLLARLSRLDLIINNAAQTIRRPPAFYKDLVEEELRIEASLPDGARKLLASPDAAAPESPDPSGLIPLHPGQSPLPALWTQIPLLPGDRREDDAYFPPGRFDADGQQIDLRPGNSWSLSLAEVAPLELLEVHAVNALAPFLLLRRLEPLLLREPGQPRHVVNVSAMEGQFNGAFKTGRHPHTNMAKAALNMITRTCAASFAERGIYLNSVDTGWITNEAPHPRAAQMAAEGFREPLDVVDGAARVLDPIFVGFATGRHPFGQFWKDYHPIPW